MNQKIHYDFIINTNITGLNLKKSSLLAHSESKISQQVQIVFFYFILATTLNLKFTPIV